MKNKIILFTEIIIFTVGDRGFTVQQLLSGQV